MEKEKAIDILTDILEGVTYQGDVEIETPDEDAALKYAIEALGNYHTWIPVAERLPNAAERLANDSEFLVQTDLGDIVVCAFDELADGFMQPKWCCSQGGGCLDGAAGAIWVGESEVRAWLI